VAAIPVKNKTRTQFGRYAMSNQPAQQRPSILPKPPSFDDEKVYLVNRIAGDIAPHLALKPEDQTNARIMGWNLVAAYSPQTEAEALHAGRIVCLSFAELGLLRDASAPNIAPALKLKYVAAAVSLNRTISESERVLERHKRAWKEEARPVDRLKPTPRDPEVDAQIEALTAQAMADYLASVAAAKAQAGEPAPDDVVSAPDVTPDLPGMDALISARAARPLFRPAADPVGPVADPAARPPSPDVDVVAAFRASVEASHAALHQSLPPGPKGPSPFQRPAGSPIRRRV
jgi:hypothetical protein